MKYLNIYLLFFFILTYHYLNYLYFLKIYIFIKSIVHVSFHLTILILGFRLTSFVFFEKDIFVILFNLLKLNGQAIDKYLKEKVS